MLRKVAMLALAAALFVSVEGTKNKTHTTKTHPSKDPQENKRKVKEFSLCETGLYNYADDGYDFRYSYLSFHVQRP